jgi:hypothetical protein
MRLHRAAPISVLVAALALVSCGEGEEPIADPPDTSAVAPTEALPLLRPATGDVGVRALIAGVVSVPGGFLAIGERLPDTPGAGDIETVTNLWRSVDGRAWEMTEADPAVWAGWTADRVAQGPAGIAVLAGGGNGRAVLTSSDGETWNATPIGPETVGLGADAFPGAFPINDVAVTESSFLALGQLVSPNGQAQPLLLVSADGVAWQPATGPALAPGAPLPEYFAGVAEAGGGTVVVTASSDPANRVMVWRSADGTTFDPVGGAELFPGVDAPVVVRLTDVAGSLVAAGHDEATGDVVVWTSTDGAAWARVDSEALGGPGVQSAAVFAQRGGRTLLVGTETPEGGGPMAGIVWATADGETWQRLPGDAEAPTAPTLQLVGAAGRGEDVAVVGSQYPGGVDLATLQMNGWWVDEVAA